MGKPIFSKKLRLLMDQEGLTQKQIAQASGVNQASVNGWLTGSIPRGDVVFELSRFLRVPMEAFFSEGNIPTLIEAAPQKLTPRQIAAIREVIDEAVSKALTAVKF